MTRGTFKMTFCHRSNLAAFQWCDSKVVNCVSSYRDFRVSSIQRQVGTERKRFLCPAALIHYQQNMGGVDRGDQMRAHFGGFASQSHFKKWYKKTVMAILDCMLLNGLRIWNMSAEKDRTRKPLSRFEFMQAVAYELLKYQTKSLVSPTRTRVHAKMNDDYHCNGRGEHRVVESVAGKRCVVCSLENTQYIDQARLLGIQGHQRVQELIKQSYCGVKRSVSYCESCNIDAHNFVLNRHSKFIHALFPGMSCMQIFHSRIGTDIWKTKSRGRKKVVSNYKHAIILEVRRAVRQHLTEG